jgi:hypothetical protein
MIWERGFDPGVFGRFDLAALAQPHLKFLFVCLFVLFYKALYTDSTHRNAAIRNACMQNAD